MDWNKPRNAWQWLLLFSPAVVAIVASQIFKWQLPTLPPLHYSGGIDIPNTAGRLHRVIGIALDVILAGSAVSALILSRGPKLGQRVINAFFFWVVLFFVNSFVAFAGCVGTCALNPTSNELDQFQDAPRAPRTPASK